MGGTFERPTLRDVTSRPLKCFPKQALIRNVPIQSVTQYTRLHWGEGGTTAFNEAVHAKGGSIRDKTIRLLTEQNPMDAVRHTLTYRAILASGG